MLMEHQPFSKGTPEAQDSAVYAPTEDERKLVKKCEALYQKSKKFKAKYDYCWLDYYKMFRGRQWKEQRPSYRASEVFNLIWETIQTQVPVVVDARPKFEYLPQEPSDRELPT